VLCILEGSDIKSLGKLALELGRDSGSLVLVGAIQKRQRSLGSEEGGRVCEGGGLMPQRELPHENKKVI
jgi:hypothetical protein